MILKRFSMPEILTAADAGREVAAANSTMAGIVTDDPSLALPLRQVRHLMTALLHGLEAAQLTAHAQAARIAELEAELARFNGRKAN
jgi:hypothetical protein